MKNIALAFVGVVILSGCNLKVEEQPYELVSTSEGTFRLNNKTGSVSMISEGAVIEMPSMSLMDSKQIELAQLFKQGMLELDGTVKLSLTNQTFKFMLSEKFASDDVYRNMEWVTAKGVLDSSVVYINLVDEDGYKIDSKRVRLDGGTRIVDRNGKVVSLSYTDKLPKLGPLEVDAIEGAEITWSLNFDVPKREKKAEPVTSS